MRRGTRPTKPKVDSQRPVAPKSKTEGSRVRDLEERLAEALKRGRRRRNSRQLPPRFSASSRARRRTS